MARARPGATEAGGPAKILLAAGAVGPRGGNLSPASDPFIPEDRGSFLPGRDVAALAGIALLAMLARDFVPPPGESGPQGAPEWIGRAVCSAASLIVLASLAARIFRSRGVAWIAAAVGAAGFLIETSSPLASEPLILILTVSAFLLLVTVDRPSSGCGVASGAALGGAVLLQSSSAILAPLLLAPLFDRRFPPAIRRALAGSAVVGLAALLAAASLGRGIRNGVWLPGGVLAGNRSPADAAAAPSLSPAALLWLFFLLVFAIRGWVRAERRGVRILALAALGLTFALPFRTGPARKTRASIVHPLLSLYGAAGISRTRKTA